MVSLFRSNASRYERSYKLLKTYNSLTLCRELIAAGISRDGNCSDDGVVFDDNGNQIQTRPDVVAILAAHDPDAILPQPATIEERLEAAELMISLLLDAPQEAV